MSSLDLERVLLFAKLGWVVSVGNRAEGWSALENHIVLMLRSGPADGREIAAVVGVDPTTVSRKMAVLLDRDYGEVGELKRPSEDVPAHSSWRAQRPGGPRCPR